MSSAAEFSYPQVAGHHALDLVDTVHWRLSETKLIDTLRSYDHVVDWCEQMGLLSPHDCAALRRSAAHEPDAAAREHSAIQEMREAIFAAVFEQLGAAAELLSTEYAGAIASARLEREADSPDNRWEWRLDLTLATPRARIALLAAELLTGDLSTARQCADDACGWVYLDTSPRHNRVWCTAAGCGNRNRVARHQSRQRNAR
ncbi:CGNR zinc finger domain-containing protein [Okibacterium fritillariae]|uniref:CGNR zinc finger domain-containing protein n=1 Tax=Okibacterium fritillariae TaxID=123320 RepID=UPI004055498A